MPINFPQMLECRVEIFSKDRPNTLLNAVENGVHFLRLLQSANKSLPKKSSIDLPILVCLPVVKASKCLMNKEPREEFLVFCSFFW